MIQEPGTAFETIDVEQLMPQTGMERQTLEQYGERFAYVPLDTEPLFEVDGLKALAEIRVSDPRSGQTEAYYVVNAPGKGYKHIHEDGSANDVDHLLVNTDFFASLSGHYDRSKYVPLRTSIKSFRGPEVIVGSIHDNTRFDKHTIHHSFRVHLESSHPSPAVTFYTDQPGIASFDIRYRRDNSHPSQFIRTHRENKNIGRSESPDAQVANGKTVRSKYVGEVMLNLTKKMHFDFHHGGVKPVPYDPTRGHFKDVYDELTFHDLTVLDDTVGLVPERVDQVVRAMHAIQDQERQEVVNAVTETVKARRLRAYIGAVTSAAVFASTIYYDNKHGAIFGESNSAQGHSAVTAVESVIMATSAWAGSAFGIKLDRARKSLNQGIDRLLPKTMVTAPDVHSTADDFIDGVAKKHVRFLHGLDESVHKLRQKHKL